MGWAGSASGLQPGLWWGCYGGNWLRCWLTPSLQSPSLPASETPPFPTLATSALLCPPFFPGMCLEPGSPLISQSLPLYLHLPPVAWQSRAIQRWGSSFNLNSERC